MAGKLGSLEHQFEKLALGQGYVKIADLKQSIAMCLARSGMTAYASVEINDVVQGAINEVLERKRRAYRPRGVEWIDQ